MNPWMEYRMVLNVGDGYPVQAHMDRGTPVEVLKRIAGLFEQYGYTDQHGVLRSVESAVVEVRTISDWTPA